MSNQPREDAVEVLRREVRLLQARLTALEHHHHPYLQTMMDGIVPYFRDDTTGSPCWVRDPEILPGSKNE
jgi:hypothetical protein